MDVQQAGQQDRHGQGDEDDGRLQINGDWLQNFDTNNNFRHRSSTWPSKKDSYGNTAIFGSPSSGLWLGNHNQVSLKIKDENNNDYEEYEDDDGNDDDDDDDDDDSSTLSDETATLAYSLAGRRYTTGSVMIPTDVKRRKSNMAASRQNNIGTLATGVVTSHQMHGHNQTIMATSHQQQKPIVINNQPRPSYVELITKAIDSSTEKRMTLSQIYDWLAENFQEFNKLRHSHSSVGWKNSVRHNLSLHERFKRLKRNGMEKPSWWTLDESKIPKNNLQSGAAQHKQSVQPAKSTRRITSDDKRSRKKRQDAKNLRRKMRRMSTGSSSNNNNNGGSTVSGRQTIVVSGSNPVSHQPNLSQLDASMLITLQQPTMTDNLTDRRFSLESTIINGESKNDFNEIIITAADSAFNSATSLMSNESSSGFNSQQQESNYATSQNTCSSVVISENLNQCQSSTNFLLKSPPTNLHAKFDELSSPSILIQNQNGPTKNFSNFNNDNNNIHEQMCSHPSYSSCCSNSTRKCLAFRVTVQIEASPDHDGIPYGDLIQFLDQYSSDLLRTANIHQLIRAKTVDGVVRQVGVPCPVSLQTKSIRHVECQTDLTFQPSSPPYTCGPTSSLLVKLLANKRCVGEPPPALVQPKVDQQYSRGQTQRQLSQFETTGPPSNKPADHLIFTDDNEKAYDSTSARDSWMQGSLQAKLEQTPETFKRDTSSACSQPSSIVDACSELQPTPSLDSQASVDFQCYLDYHLQNLPEDLAGLNVEGDLRCDIMDVLRADMERI